MVAHNSQEERREQDRVDANREMSVQAQRSINEILKTATQRRGWYGKVQVIVTVEDGTATMIDETSNRTHRRRRH